MTGMAMGAMIAGGYACVMWAGGWVGVAAVAVHAAVMLLGTWRRK